MNRILKYKLRYLPGTCIVRDRYRVRTEGPIPNCDQNILKHQIETIITPQKRCGKHGGNHWELGPQSTSSFALRFHPGLQVDGAMNSLGVFLGQEAVRFNGLMGVMRSTLSELQKAIR